MFLLYLEATSVSNTKGTEACVFFFFKIGLEFYRAVMFFLMLPSSKVLFLLNV